MGGDKGFLVFFGSVMLVIGLGVLGIGIAVQISSGPKSLGYPHLAWILGGAGLAVAVFGGLLLRHALAAIAYDRRLIESGIAIVGTVTDIRGSAARINDMPRWHVRYRYTYGGAVFEGESRMLPGAAVRQFQPGDQVRVVVNPQQPKENLFLGAA